MSSMYESPAATAETLSGSTSSATTSSPASANATTSGNPTYPSPTTPTFISGRASEVVGVGAWAKIASPERQLRRLAPPVLQQRSGQSRFSPAERYDPSWTVLGGVLAVPCTRNPL